MPTAAQFRAARAALNLKQADVAAAAGTPLPTVKLLERGGTDHRGSTVRKLQEWYEGQGVVFQADGEMKAGGPGVRFPDEPPDPQA